jgi:ferredoxin
MASITIPSAKKKKIKKVLALMNKQNRRFVPIVKPLIEMMDMSTNDNELDFILTMGTERFDYKNALNKSNMKDVFFKDFFEKIKRKGLVHAEHDSSGDEIYRINAIVVGWYEVMMFYNKGNPQATDFYDKFIEFFKTFQKFNFFPIRELQNIIMRKFKYPTQSIGLMAPTKESSIRKKITINTTVSDMETNVYPTYAVSQLIEQFATNGNIYAFPCICRNGKNLIKSPCNFDFPEVSCIGFGSVARIWSSWGYGKFVSKEEALNIITAARNKGAIHTVIHERDDTRLPASAICNCCWDCCGILMGYNMGATAISYKAHFVAKIKDNIDCSNCGSCGKYCPTTAMKLEDKKPILNIDKCFGCGQCAYQCPNNNIELFTLERNVFLPLLKKSEIRVMI